MYRSEFEEVARGLGSAIVGVTDLAGGYSHLTSLLTLDSGPVVVRIGGANPRIEAAVMARATVPTPRVLLVDDHLMALEYVEAAVLSDALREAHDDLEQLGHAVARTALGIGDVAFDQPGLFADEQLNVRAWSEQLPEFAAACMRRVPDARLSPAERRAWVELCTAEAPLLRAVDRVARLVHGDFNPKNLLVARTVDGWTVAAVLDWEFSFSGCPFADAANMLRFAADYPAAFVAGFRAGYGNDGWEETGRAIDLFALSDLATRPPGNDVADRAAVEMRRRLG
jgi:aminoglycoside phosphotransferase (APT) family kinase protein